MTTGLPLTIAPALLEALGRLVTEFNALELWVSLETWALLGCDQEACQLVTAKLQFNAKVELFRDLFHHRVSDTKRVAAINKMVERLQKAGATRNELVHGMWSVSNAAGESLTVNMRRKGTPFTKRTISTLAAATADIQQLVRELVKMNADRGPTPKS